MLSAIPNSLTLLLESIKGIERQPDQQKQHHQLGPFPLGSQRGNF